MIIPTVVEKEGNREVAFDLLSRLMKDRIIFVSGEINQEMANIVVAQLLFLEKEDSKKDIQMFINSHGGQITSGYAIIDTMNFIKPDVSTICVGFAASMGASILAAGAQGKRYALPHAEVMIHQPLIPGGMGGAASDLEIRVNNLLSSKEDLINDLSEWTGKSKEQIAKDVDRDNYMKAEDAKEYGLIDDVLYERS